MNIYVGNMPYSMSEDDLRNLFGTYGGVSSARLVMDRDTGRAKGFGFVEMDNAGEAQAAIEAINYYGGTVAGLSAIFATATECLGIPVTSIFDPSNLPDYASFDSRECPMCKAGQHIDALVNSFGYSAL